MNNRKAWEFLNSPMADVIIKACKYMEEDVAYMYLRDCLQAGTLTEEQYIELRDYVIFCLQQAENA